VQGNRKTKRSARSGQVDLRNNLSNESKENNRMQKPRSSWRKKDIDMEQINWKEMDEHWAQQFAEDYAEFVQIYGVATA
jgi:hypothetical protein